MSKKAAFYQLAKVAYIYEGKTFREIELMLNEEVTERTLRTWAADGEWKEKKRKYHESQQPFREKLDKLKHVLVDHALETKDPQIIYALVNLVKAENPLRAAQLKQIEEDTRKADAGDEGVSEETINQFKKDFLGIK